MHILDDEAKGLAEKLQLLPFEQRKQIIARTCIAASQDIINVEPKIQNLLTTINAYNSLSKSQLEEAKLLADYADEQYFLLQEKGTTDSDWLNWFSKARLLTAIAIGFESSSWKNTADAIYELCKTTDNPSKIVSIVELEIEKLR
jgi:hypothetical protein